MSNEKEIGYLTKAVEDLAVMLQKHMRKEEEDRVITMARLSSIEKDISLVKLLLKIAKYSAVTVLFIITLKLGDIKTLWATLHLSG